MNEDTSKKPSILKQLIRGLLMASAVVAVVAAILIVLSFLLRPNPDHKGIIVTRMNLQSLARAIDAFESEYQKLPDVSSLDLETEGPQAVKLITILLGKETTPESEMQNRRQIAFLTARIIRNRKQGGLLYSSSNEVQGMYDAWGNPLRIILRPPGETEISISHLGKQVLVNKPAVVLSRGPDQKWGTKDDLMSTDEAR